MWYHERAREIDRLSGEVGLNSAIYMCELLLANSTGTTFFNSHRDSKRLWNKGISNGMLILSTKNLM